MMLTRVLAISSYLIILFRTSDTYCKTFRLKAHSDTLKKYLYGILDYTKVELFYPPMRQATHKHCPYQQMGSKSLQMVHSHISGLDTSVYPGTGTPLGCIQSHIQPLR